MNNDSIENAIPFNFTDFLASDIESIARDNGYAYIRQEPLLASTHTLYENPRTNGMQIHKLNFTVDNLPCEYYTCWYLPVSVAGGGLEKSDSSATDSNRMSIQVFSVTLPYLVEDLYVQSKVNVNLGSILGITMPFKQSARIQLEGSFNRFFNVFTPLNEELTAFTILAPNIMAKMIIEASNYDFEFTNNKIYFYDTPGYVQPDTISMTKVEYNKMFNFGLESARQLARASRPTRRPEGQNISMWQLYDPSRSVVSLLLRIIIGLFILTIPLLWPVGLYFIIRYFRNRTYLKKVQGELASS